MTGTRPHEQGGSRRVKWLLGTEDKEPRAVIGKSGRSARQSISPRWPPAQRHRKTFSASVAWTWGTSYLWANGSHPLPGSVSGP